MTQKKVKKIKVKALAEELKLDPKELIKMLKDLGVEVKTAASSVEEETAKIVREIVKPKEKPAEKVEEVIETVKEEPGKPEVKTNIPVIETEDISVKDLADLIQVKSSDLIKEVMKKGTLATINQRINAEMAKDVAGNLGKEVIVKTPEVVAEVEHEVKADNLIIRPPIVTVMGHVDHGKTKLLDAIRQTRVAEGEAGGITQHIGAYQIDVHGKKVTFLDTPGHEAFTALRARGAKVTDITILVVAADDGIMPQTIEAIDHSKAAGVPIIVALNKIDRPESNPDRVKQQLSEHGLAPEDWGGKTIVVPTSAKQQQGIKELLEMILLVAEVQELKADPNGTPSGVVIESKLEKGRGPVANILIKNGTLRVGDIITIGSTSGRVRALFSDKGERLKEAGPSTPVAVLGCVSVPKSGDSLQVMSSEKEARGLAEKRGDQQNRAFRGKILSLQDFSEHVKDGEKQNLNLVIKADVQGSIDAIVQSLQDMTIGNIKVNIIHAAVGQVNESDIMLARASSAIATGFNVGLEGNAEAVAQQEGVEVKKYNIIYKLIDDIKLAMEGMLAPEFEEVVLGHAEVRQLFKFSKVGAIAGSFVTDGLLKRGTNLRIIRDKKQIYEGKLPSLKRFKDDVKQVEQSFECGIAIPGYNDFKVGDIVECFEIREKARKK